MQETAVKHADGGKGHIKCSTRRSSIGAVQGGNHLPDIWGRLQEEGAFGMGPCTLIANLEEPDRK